MAAILKRETEQQEKERQKVRFCYVSHTLAATRNSTHRAYYCRLVKRSNFVSSNSKRSSYNANSSNSNKKLNCGSSKRRCANSNNAKR